MAKRVIEEKVSQFREWINEKMIQWEAAHKKRVTVSQFAKILGVSQASLSNWMDGNRVPDIANAIILARTFGPEVFIQLNYPRMVEITDDKFFDVVIAWKNLNQEEKQEIIDTAKRDRNDKYGPK